MTMRPTWRPTVGIDSGLRIDDAFARRLVGAMLDELATEQQASGAAREGAHQSAAGNPKAQRRVFDRFTAQLGKYLLSSGLTTGKNAKFWMGVEYWTVTSANPDNGTIGPNAWLVGIRSEMEGLGRGQPMQAHTSEMVALSRHALERLVQRGAVATNEDLVTIMRNGWTTLTLALAAMLDEEHGGIARDGVTAWTIPVLMPNGKAIYLPVLRNLDRGPMAIVPTALSKDMIVNLGALAPLENLIVEAKTAADPQAALAALAGTARLHAAMAETAKATRRGKEL